jgi:DNA ligase 1
MFFYIKNAKKFSTNNSQKFINLCNMFKSVEESPSLLQKKRLLTSYLSNFIKDINKNKSNPEIIQQNFTNIGEITKVCIPYLNLIQNKIDIRDKQSSLDINLRYQYTFDFMIKTYISKNFDVDPKVIQKEYIKQGDLAKYLSHLISKDLRFPYLSPSREILNTAEVLNYKENINKAIGNSSMEHKLKIFSELIQNCHHLNEVLYVGRIFLNKLKIGMAEKNLLKCIFNLEIEFDDKENFRKLITYLEKEVFMYQIYYPMKLVESSGKNVYDPDSLDFEPSLRPGTYVDLQLGRPGMDLETLISTLSKSTQTCLVETKYDGERSQMHFDGNEITMASRSSQDQTQLYQNLKNKIKTDVLEFNKKHPLTRIENFIIDGEITCYSHKYKNFRPFQELRKKLNLNEDKDHRENQYFFVAFDILYLNNVNLHDAQLDERKKFLKDIFYKRFSNILVEGGKVIKLDNFEKAKKEIIKQYKYAKSVNCEGLVAKEMGKTSMYQFGKRRWYKLKTLNESVTDTLDLVPIAGFIGKGSSKNQMNSFLVSVFDPVSKNFIGLCKIGTGFVQQDLVDIQNRFLPNLLKEAPDNYIIPRLQRPTFIFKPIEVWEVGFDSFTESLNYSLGKGEVFPDKGLCLRFPRFIRFRPDKKVFQGTSPEEVKFLYKNLNSRDHIII